MFNTIIIIIIIYFNDIRNSKVIGCSNILTCNSYGGAGLWWSICLAMASHTLDAELTTAVTCKLVGVIST